MPVRIGRSTLAWDRPVYVVAEIGVNHNGDPEQAKRIASAAAWAGCDAVKFQVRTPELATPDRLRDVLRDSPFGRVTHLEHRQRMELGEDFWSWMAGCSAGMRLDWFASCWDIPSIERMAKYPMVAHKVASACLTDTALVEAMSTSGLPMVMSTGMAWRDLVKAMAPYADVLCHTVSAYPCPLEDLNLKAITHGVGQWLTGKQELGYSGHEAPELGNWPTLCAVAMGARYVERHFTIDRSLPGSDQRASLDPEGMASLVSEIRQLERALGDGEKGIRECELPALEKLRRAA